MTNERPNLLLIFIDSLRADRVGCYGYPRHVTPTLDQLAREGCRFTRAISAAPFSPASYALIVSGLYPHQHGVTGDDVRVWPETMPRLPSTLRERGYRTFCFSNNSFVSRETGAAAGFDHFIDRDDSWLARQRHRGYRWVRRQLGDRRAKRLSNTMHCAAKGDSAATLRRAADLIRVLPEPWFGVVILMDPHTPYNRRRTGRCGNGADVRRFFAERNDRAMWAELMADHGRLSPEELAVVSELYDEEARHADACLGAFQDTPASREKLDRTVLAVAADHGEAFGEHGVWGHGFCLNDCLTRVPLILRYPEWFAPHTTSDALIQLHDLHDTCLSFASRGEHLNGESAHDLRQAAEPHWPGRQAAFSEFPRQSRTLDYMGRHTPGFEPDFGVLDRVYLVSLPPLPAELTEEGQGAGP
jgi:arylsulfatase A-like enzyme